MNNSQNKQTVAVIGAGIIGICTAIELQQAGFHVTLFDKDEPAKQASFGNASYLAAEYTEPLATPKNIITSLQKTFTKNAAFKVTPDHLIKFIPWGLRFIKASQKTERSISRSGIGYLNKRAIESWKRLLKLTGNSECLLQSGFIKLWENHSDLAKTRVLMEQIKASGLEVKLLQGDALFKQEPALSGKNSHGLYYPNAYQLDEAYEVCIKLFQFFQKQGGMFHQSSVNNIQVTQTGIKLQTTHGEYSFDKAIIATGAWGKQLSKSLGINVPLAAERGYHLTLPADFNVPRHILESTDRHVVLTSVNSGLRIVGFGEYGNLNSKPTDKRYLQLKHHLSNIIKTPNYTHRCIETWMGIRPTFPDSLPVIDLHPKYPQIGMVFGHHHLGMTQAAISAELITAMIIKGASNETETNAFSVSRF